MSFACVVSLSMTTKVLPFTESTLTAGFFLSYQTRIFAGEPSYLEKILPWCKPEETCLVYSQYHGYIDKREGNTAFNQKLYDFVEQFRERGCFVKEDLHTSGHASKQDLVRLCEQVNPKVIIPIHKDEKADFASILSDELRARVCEYEYSMDGVDISLDSL